MLNILSNLKITINDNIFLKDPESSSLGKRIVENSILLIDEIGFDAFTFKKLGAKIGSNESSIYRYFENKHNLLVYLASWYWSWTEYQLVFAINNITDPIKKLNIAIDILTRTTTLDSNFAHIDEVVLKRIIIHEYSKSYLTKQVDLDNDEGYFSIYKRIVLRLKELIHEANKDYKHPFCLANTVIEGALHQQYLKDHFKSISGLKSNEAPTAFYKDLVFNTLNITLNE